jgi:drug/metabolite transporter (DMT)-like permease
MPKSKGRPTRRSTRYQLDPQKPKRSKPSPRWYGPLMLGIMAVGVALIVWNYTRDLEASNTVLLTGLGLIGVGFFGVTFWK